MWTVRRNEMQLYAAAGLRQPCLHQFRVMVPGIIKKDMNEPHARIHRLGRRQQRDRTDGIHRRHIVHDGLTGLEIDHAMDVQPVPPAALFNRTGVSLGAQQPTGRTAWVGWTASPKTTASSLGSWFSSAL